MRGISLWQPWASLFVGTIEKPAPKRYETRHWPTKYRGWLAIQAAKRRTSLGEMGPELAALVTRKGFEDLPHGVLVGAVFLDHCQHVDRILADYLAETDPDSLVCGNWRGGRWAWRRSAAVPLLEPIPFKGYQGFFNVPDDTFPAEFWDRLRACAT